MDESRSGEGGRPAQLPVDQQALLRFAGECEGERDERDSRADGDGRRHVQADVHSRINTRPMSWERQVDGWQLSKDVDDGR